MVRGLTLFACVAALAGLSAPVLAGCPGCKTVSEKSEGFCCGKGKVFGVELASKKLYEALAGQEVDTAKMKCPGCKHAAKTEGSCTHCKVSVANGKMYHSPVAYVLAKGMVVTAEQAAKCPGCKTAFETSGNCSACNVGFVAHRGFKGDDSITAAKAAFATLTKAVKTAKHCEACAVAMVTDGKCEHCNVSFKDGQKL